MDINAILKFDSASAISQLKEKSISVPSWSVLSRDFDPSKHDIVANKNSRKDKILDNGTIEKVARIHIGLEQLIAKRMTEFCFALPVQRHYYCSDEKIDIEPIKKVIENIYTKARIDSENIKRWHSYFASCEVATIWYTIENNNNLYGIQSDYKLKCVSYSPMDNVNLYPLLDEYGDMVAMSFEYTKKVLDKEIQFFETYTKNKHIKWQANGNGYEELVNIDIKLEKIPCIYQYRDNPIYHGISHLRNEMEYAISRNSDVIAYNSAPILKVTGNLHGEEEKGECQRVIRTEIGGDVSYVSWSQSTEAVKQHIDTMQSLAFKLCQMPDISFENMAKLGNIGYDARRTLLTDAHLKVGDESGKIKEFLDREVNVVKAFVKQMKPEWSDALDLIEIENEIIPFIQNDETATINRLMTANGGKAIMSQLESIRLANYSNDAQKTLKEIQAETATEQQATMGSLFGKMNESAM